MCLQLGPFQSSQYYKGLTLHYLSLIIEVAVHQITGLIFIEILHSTWVDDPLQSGKWRVPLNPAIVFPSVPFAGVDLKRNVLLHQSQNLMKILFWDWPSKILCFQNPIIGLLVRGSSSSSYASEQWWYVKNFEWSGVEKDVCLLAPLSLSLSLSYTPNTQTLSMSLFLCSFSLLSTLFLTPVLSFSLFLSLLSHSVLVLSLSLCLCSYTFFTIFAHSSLYVGIGPLCVLVSILQVGGCSWEWCDARDSLKECLFLACCV